MRRYLEQVTAKVKALGGDDDGPGDHDHDHDHDRDDDDGHER
jgi:hypothetical protein